VALFTNCSPPDSTTRTGIAVESGVDRHENPALELVREDGLEHAAYTSFGDRFVVKSQSWSLSLNAQIEARLSTFEQLESQLRLVASGLALGMALNMLYSLDERGYLGAPVEQLAAEFGTSLGAIHRGLKPYTRSSRLGSAHEICMSVCYFDALISKVWVKTVRLQSEFLTRAGRISTTRVGIM
jgi:hypothetical protein